ncbi:hypothetical protein GGX14DRAFT_637575 [Mycena pura]|uniref:Uncharacterized protein n=1 Tax=Mycena pura TaxID=153505 RepID=A0AAD6YF46_9AGAR|nr:hypothetical protein GGX14DRAFT_637575 [Mycena pura]
MHRTLHHTGMRKLPRNFRIDDIPPCYDVAVAMAQLEALTADEKARLSLGMNIAASDPQANAYFEEAASEAAGAIAEIETMFLTLKGKFSHLTDGGADFLPEFNTIQSAFRTVVSDSRTLAVHIAVYAERFDDIIIKFCADTNLTVAQRIAQIDKFIAEGEVFRADAERMHWRFLDLTDNFGDFTIKFRTWGEQFESEKTEGIEVLEKQIIDLRVKIANLNTAITAVGAAVLGAATALAAMIGLFFVVGPVAGLFIIAGGAVVGGIAISGIIALPGLLIAKNNSEKELSDKEKEVTRLEGEIKTIQGMRAELEQEGEHGLKTFIHNAGILQSIWQGVKSDAEQIKIWLEHGADMAEYPDYMKDNLEHSVRLYKKMAKYLNDYARGVTRIGEGIRKTCRCSHSTVNANLSIGVDRAGSLPQAEHFVHTRSSPDIERSIEEIYGILSSFWWLIDTLGASHLDSDLDHIRVQFLHGRVNGKSLAVYAGVCAPRFVQDIVKFCADTNLTVQQRVKQIQGFIEGHERIIINNVNEMQSWAATIKGLVLTLAHDISAIKNQFVREKHAFKRPEAPGSCSKVKKIKVPDETDLALSFGIHLSVLQDAWSKADVDGGTILLWLQTALNYANFPEYMRLALEECVPLYNTMAEYLTHYAYVVT